MHKTPVRLSSPVEEIETHVPVLVIGSGYGGAVAASRLSRAGQRVFLFERGREFLPGELPKTSHAVAREFRVDSPLGAFSAGPGKHGFPEGGPANGLYQLHIDTRMCVLTGSGLGGTSLINANVVFRPDPRVFEDPRWPAEIRADAAAADGLLAQCMSDAERMLGATTYPETLPVPPKTAALRAAAERLGQPSHLVPLAVTFTDGPNAAGFEQRACTLCGDCLTGCNERAKNTLDRNYLPDAHRHGALIFTGVEVRRIERAEDRWAVYYRVLDAEGEGGDDAGDPDDAPPDQLITADLVVLAAGVLGTAQILLRSRELGLAMSDKVGHHFSVNRNALGFGFDVTEPVRGIGFGDRPPESCPPVGPLITAAVDLRDTPDVDDGLIVEEGVVPGALASGFLAGIATAAAVLSVVRQPGGVPERKPHDGGLRATLRALGDTVESAILGPTHGALDRTLTLLAMGHDRSPGRLTYDGERVRVEWPEGLEGHAKAPTDAMERLVDALGGTYVPNPAFAALPWHPLIAVQPLGGCVLADDAEQGAVNHAGKLFCDAQGTAVHDGLLVLDASIVPRSTGLNPLLTIAALAERAIRLLVAERGWAA